MLHPQQFLDGNLLPVVMSGQKSHFNGGSRLKPVTTCHLRFVVKL